MRFLVHRGLIALLVLGATPLYAGVRLAALFANHMVIQRNEPVHV